MTRFSAALRACSFLLALALGTFGLFAFSARASADAPSPVSDLVVTPQIGEFAISWTEPTDASYDHADVVILTAGTATPQTVVNTSVAGGTDDFTTTTLHQGVAYNVEVFAADSSDDRSNPQTLLTSTLTDVQPVSNLQVNTSDRTVEMTWTPSPDTPDAVVRYYSGNGGAPPSLAYGADGGSSSTGSLTLHLPPGAAGVSVFAQDGDDYSAPVRATGLTVAGNPLKPANGFTSGAIDQHSLRLFWNAPTDSDRTTWEVHVVAGVAADGVAITDPLACTTTSDQCVVSGLAYNAPYTFGVFPIDAATGEVGDQAFTTETTRIPGSFVAASGHTTTLSSSPNIESSVTAVDKSGAEYAAYIQYAASSANLYFTTRKPGGAWSARHKLLGSGLVQFNVKESVSPDGAVAIAWEQDAASGKASSADGVWVAYRAAGKTTWTQRHLAKADGYLVGVVEDRSDRVHVVWMYARGSASKIGLFSDDNANKGRWAPPVKIAGTGIAEVHGDLNGNAALTINPTTNALAIVINQEHFAPFTDTVAVATKPATTTAHPSSKWSKLSPRLSQDASTGALLAGGVAYYGKHLWITISKELADPTREDAGVYLLSGTAATNVGHPTQIGDFYNVFGVPAVAAKGTLAIAFERYSPQFTPGSQGLYLTVDKATGWSTPTQLSQSPDDDLQSLALDPAGHPVVDWLRN